MGILERVEAARAETRAEARAVQVPWQPWTSPYVPYSAGGPVHPSEFAIGVESSLRLAPLFAGVRLIADMVASLPVQQYRRPPGGKPVKISTSPLLDKPASYGTVYDWIFQCMSSLLLQGNAWGLITGRDGYGYPTSIEWLPAERVTVIEDELQPWNPVRARIVFYGNQLNREDLFHVRAFTMPGRVAGLSPLRQFMTLIGAGNDQLEYGASWFRSGGWPPGTFQNMEREVDADSADEIRRRLTSSIRRREALVYGRDWDYKPVSVPPSEAQFIQATQMTATQIAAVLGIPPERIGGARGDSLTYSTQEQESISLITDTLRPWLVRLETALFDVLPQQQYVRFDTRAMLKTTTQQRHEIYKLDRDMGILTPDEIRDMEEMGPIGGGIGKDPIALQVLVAMARGIKEIPKSLLPLVQESPADALQREQALVLAQQAAANPDQPPPPVYPEKASAGSQNGSSGGQDGSGDGQEPAARWGDYHLDPADIRKIMNGASHG